MTTRVEVPTSETLRLRDECWDDHPIIVTNAVLPTAPIGWVLGHVLKWGRRQQAGGAFWAEPRTGKSSCIRAIVRVIAMKFPGAGVLVYEAKKDIVCAEGSLIEDMLLAMEFEGKRPRRLPDMRDQLCRAFFALSAKRRHLFLIFDEAQCLHAIQLEWIKCYINFLVKRGYRVTVVMFGQHELIGMRNRIMMRGRSDLNFRFMEHFLQFEAILCGNDILALLIACDQESEYPSGSGVSYTQFLWPRSFEAGFRLSDQLLAICIGFGMAIEGKLTHEGIAMEYVARTLAELAELTRDRDSTGFLPSKEDWKMAVTLSGYFDRPPIQSLRDNDDNDDTGLRRDAL
ncbi:ATP-binding protein [Rhodanobacter sp. AS-Z3]|uniref:ATP-binding protein n=1 Tax=Rhodanobacter sp. AS-Z3 TaxID=3031330 RepID=UPI00247B1BA7|nr:ATP-binding protein [Rhodanobacter sp. AS-Z3]WEN13766.1 ATP-binding protein [Rhodanobacter sp. AS-Z3]